MCEVRRGSRCQGKEEMNFELLYAQVSQRAGMREQRRKSKPEKDEYSERG